MKKYQSPSRSRAVVILAVSLLATLLVTPITASAQDDEPGFAVGSFQGNVLRTSGPGARGTRLTLRIDRWSTDEERQALLQAITENQARSRRANRAVPDALRDQDRVGLASITGGRGYPLRFAAYYDAGGGKTRVVLATNRQIDFGEAVDSSNVSLDFSVSVVDMILDAEGNGEGTVGYATELRWNEEKQQIEPVSLNMQPMRFGNIIRTN